MAREARLGEGAGERHWPGATAIAALIVGGELWVANAGDCRGVLCRGGKALALSRDHTADDDAERGRLTAAGGAASWCGDGWRVGEAGIQVSRSVFPLSLVYSM